MTLFYIFPHKLKIRWIFTALQYCKAGFINFSIELKSRKIENVTEVQEDWKVHLIDTGKDSMTGGRLFRLKEHLKNDDTFMLTYGDGLSDINISKLLEFHKAHKKIATVTAVRPPARFGALEIKDGKGSVVRRYSSAEKSAPVKDTGNVPAYWIRPPQILSGEAGMHRFLWDLHYAPVPNVETGFPIAAIYGRTAPNSCALR